MNAFGNDTERDEDVEEFTLPAAHDLPDDIVQNGGATLKDYDGADMKRLDDGREVNEIAWQATGNTNGDRDVSDGERGVIAERIDTSVRAYRSWVQSRPLDEQIALRDSPVIFTPEA